jgi:hypothetical protein
MTTLYDAILQTAMFSGVCVSGVSTASGTSTKLIDSTRHEQDKYFDAGTLFIQSGTFLGLSGRIKSYSIATTSFELFEPFDDVIPANVRYTATNLNREMLVQAVNQALAHMGLYTVVDETLIGESGITEYELPEKVDNVVKIDEITTTTSFTPVKTWREYAGKLYMEEPLSGGVPLRLYYNRLHPTVSGDGDRIDSAFHLTRLAWTATYFFELSRLQYLGTNADKQSALFMNAQQQMAKQERVHLVRKLERPGNLARY